MLDQNYYYARDGTGFALYIGTMKCVVSGLDVLKMAASEVRRSVGVQSQTDRPHENLLAGKTKIRVIGMRGRWCDC
jgi:hypothetical protein